MMEHLGTVVTQWCITVRLELVLYSTNLGMQVIFIHDPPPPPPPPPYDQFRLIGQRRRAE
jgi:hypothetical protein